MKPLRKVVGSIALEPPAVLTVWQLTLECGHKVKRASTLPLKQVRCNVCPEWKTCPVCNGFGPGDGEDFCSDCGKPSESYESESYEDA